MKKKNSNPVGALKRTGAYMSSSMGIIIFALVLAALSAVMTIIGPDKIGKMATIMSDGLFTGIDLAAIAKIGVFLAIIYCLSALFGFIQHYIMAVVTLKMSYRMRGELSEKINRVPQKYFNTTSQGDILSRITNDVSTLQQGLTNSLPTIISAATQFVGCLIMMFVTEWRMALVALCITLLGMVLIVAIMSKSQRYFTARQKSLGELNGYVEEMYSGHEVVRISRAVDKVLDHFDGLNAAVYDANWRSQFLSGVMQPLMNVIGNLAYVAVCVFGSVLAINGTIEFGVIVSFILYVRLFTTPLTQIAQGMTNLQTASASAHRIFDFLESEELGDESDKTEKLDAVRGAVTFDHVRFSYPDSPDKIIIKDFSAEVHPGQKVAIVGPTGAGKTTVVNLLMRFFEVNSGRITIDGVATTDLRREDVHELFGMVLQDTWLFEGTIRENLVYNMEGITDEQLETVCKACGLDKFVHSLPQGFDTVLSESTTISAGQKQLLTIARAMLQNAPIMSKSQRYFTARQKSLGELNGYVEEMYSGHEVVRISRAVDKVLDHFDGLNAAVYDANWRSQFLSGVMQPLMNVIGNLAYVAVCVFGSVLAINGTIEFGVIVSFILYVRLFTTPLTQIAQGMTNLQTASASAHRIFDFLESEELGDESDKTEKLDAVRGAVTFDHVRFSYPDSPDKIIIKDFSAEVHPGQKVAIVGPTGAGKTTVVNLLMRFFEVNSGRITIDGVATTDLRREDVHELFGMVLQDTWLFEGTIRENLVYNMEGITDEQLETVCKACGLDKFVHSLPQGFDTVLSESTTISAGQKQLLTIARAMLQNAPMLILDEATSSVDTRTELLIQRAMDELTKGRTSFVIAHRLSTIKNADLILVMRDGDVIESGTHEQLMEQNGFYAELYNSQFAQAS